MLGILFGRHDFHPRIAFSSAEWLIPPFNEALFSIV
jgi:hypothetical protein